MDPIFFIIIIAVICLAVFGRALFAERFPYKSRHTLLSPAELHFYKSLQKIIPSDCEIHAKVRLADIVTVNDKDWPAYGPKIAYKHIDFVLVQKNTSQIICAIELDDKSHNTPERKVRDAFVDQVMQAATVPLHHIKAQKNYNLEDLRNALNRLAVHTSDSQVISGGK